MILPFPEIIIRGLAMINDKIKHELKNSSNSRLFELMVKYQDNFLVIKAIAKELNKRLSRYKLRG